MDNATYNELFKPKAKAHIVNLSLNISLCLARIDDLDYQVRLYDLHRITTAAQEASDALELERKNIPRYIDGVFADRDNADLKDLVMKNVNETLGLMRSARELDPDDDNCGFDLHRIESRLIELADALYDMLNSY